MAKAAATPGGIASEQPDPNAKPATTTEPSAAQAQGAGIPPCAVGAEELKAAEAGDGVALHTARHPGSLSEEDEAYLESCDISVTFTKDGQSVTVAYDHEGEEPDMQKILQELKAKIAAVLGGKVEEPAPPAPVVHGQVIAAAAPMTAKTAPPNDPLAAKYAKAAELGHVLPAQGERGGCTRCGNAAWWCLDGNPCVPKT